MTTAHERALPALLGALTADAASLGLHWLYDTDRIALVENQRGRADFLDPQASDFNGARGYFAHGRLQAGDVSHYGASLQVMLRHLAARDSFSPGAYESEFVAHFGPGGDFRGYIDHATRVTLQNHEAQGRRKSPPDDLSWSPLGAKDDEAGATAKLPPLVARYAGDTRLAQFVETAVRITHDDADAVSWSLIAATLLEKVIQGAGIPEGLNAALESAPRPQRALLETALSLPKSDPLGAIQQLGQSCPLSKVVPSVFYLLSHWPDYAEAVRVNIRAGGDSCGRAILLGATLGAAMGCGGPHGIPLGWTLKTHGNTEAAELWNRLAE
jgi:ADP-ribosylglycohydrolase